MRLFIRGHTEIQAQKRIPKIRYLSSWGTRVVLKWPSGGPGAGLCPAPGPPKGHVSTTLAPHEIKYLIYPFCAMIHQEGTSLNQKTARPLAQNLPKPRGEQKYGRRTSPKFATLKSLIFRFARRYVCISSASRPKLQHHNHHILTPRLKTAT